MPIRGDSSFDRKTPEKDPIETVYVFTVVRCEDGYTEGFGDPSLEVLFKAIQAWKEECHFRPEFGVVSIRQVDFYPIRAALENDRLFFGPQEREAQRAYHVALAADPMDAQGNDPEEKDRVLPRPDLQPRLLDLVQYHAEFETLRARPGCQDTLLVIQHGIDNNCPSNVLNPMLKDLRDAVLRHCLNTGLLNSKQVLEYTGFYRQDRLFRDQRFY